MFKKIFFSLIFILSLAISQSAHAAPIGLTRYAWSSNIGWISFAGPSYQVFLDQTTGTFSGYAWSSNIGWIDFNGTRLDGSTFARAVAPEASGSSGWDGKIKLAGSNYGVTVDGEYLKGFAWGGDVVGWIKFYSGNGGGGGGGGGGYGVHIGGPIPPQSGLIVSCASPTSLSNGDAIWLATVSGGTAPYSFSWLMNAQSVTGHSSTVNSSTFTMSDIDDGTYSVVARVRDRNNIDSGSVACQLVVIDDGDVVRDPVYPDLVTIAPQDRVSISSQPLTSPARSSGIGIEARSIGPADPLQVRVLDIVSLTTGKSLLKTEAEGGILTGTGNQRLPGCYLGSVPLDGTGVFSPACAVSPITMEGGDQAYFNLEIHRPVQALKDNNPYRVILGDSHGEVSFLFDYRVGTVNPF